MALVIENRVPVQFSLNVSRKFSFKSAIRWHSGHLALTNQLMENGGENENEAAEREREREPFPCKKIGFENFGCFVFSLDISYWFIYKCSIFGVKKC